MGPVRPGNMEEEKFRIPTFNGNNFGSWKFRLEAILDQHDLIQFIKKSLEEIIQEIEQGNKSPEEKEKEIIKIMKSEKKCKSLVINCIGDEQLEHIKDKARAKEIFETLKAIFERKSIVNQLYLRKRLFTTRYNEEDDMNQYILNFDKMIRELKEAGAKIDDFDIICHLLLSLPKSFDAVVAVLETLEQERLTLELVKTRLIDEYYKQRNSRSSFEENVPSAFNGKKSFNYQCYKCGKFGHKRSECRVKCNSGRNFSNNGNYQYENRNRTSSRFIKKSGNLCSNEEMEQGFEDDEEISFIVNAGSNIESLSVQCMEIKWYIDSGASDHMVNSLEYFFNVENLAVPVEIAVAKDGQTMKALKRGTIKMFDNDIKRSIIVRNVLYVPNLKYNLLSVKRMEENGFEIYFKNGAATISRNGEIYLRTQRKGKLYEAVFVYSVNGIASITEEISNELEVWHQRFGHLNELSLNQLVRKEMVTGMPSKLNGKLNFCKICVESKMAHLPYKQVKYSKSSRPLELIHSDVCGPINPVTWNGKKYFVTFIDDYTNFVSVYLMSSRNEVFKYLKEFKAAAEIHFERKISRLRTDNGGEYTSREMQDYLKESGIQSEFTIPDNPSQNGKAERMNRTLVERARALAINAKMPKFLWGEAILCATYITNRCPTRSMQEENINCTPAELWYKRKPDAGKLKIFGCVAYNLVTDKQRGKFDPKCEKLFMVGYCTNGYRLWNSIKRKVITGRNVKFDEKSLYGGEIQNNEFVYVRNSNDGCDEFIFENEYEIKENEQIKEKNTQHNETQEDNTNTTGDEIEIRSRPKRTVKPPERYQDFNISNVVFALNTEVDENVPKTFADIINSTDKNEWYAAVKEEMNSLVKNSTWTLVDLPKDKTAIDNKWTFRIKRKSNGEIERYKARLVAKGFTQKFGEDYWETFAPVAKITSIRIMLAIANKEKLYIHQMDVKCAFLNGDLHETVYMKQPEGFKSGNKVCKLNKTLYGLKQASRGWNERFNTYIKRLGFKRLTSDPCIYTFSSNSKKIYIMIYVDDILLMSNDMYQIKIIKEYLSQEFEMKDLGEVEYFLGIKIERDIQNSITKISQQEYIENIIKKFKMEESKTMSTPIEKGLQLNKADFSDLTEKPYKELLGSLMYLMICSRPDISFAVGYLSRFQSCASEEHWQYLKRIIRYLILTKHLKLVYRNDERNQVIGYVDADWASDKTDRKSTTGYVFKIYGCTVIWASKKQTSVSLSSTEAEYIALSNAMCDYLWLTSLLEELEIKIASSIVYEDNQSVIHHLKQFGHSHKLKHVDIRYNFVKELFTEKNIELKYINTIEQQADILTKGLGRTLFEKFRNCLGLSS